MIPAGDSRWLSGIRVAAIVVGLILWTGGIVWIFRKAPVATLPPAVVAAIDSERASRAATDSTLLALQAAAAELKARADAADRRAVALQGAAERLGARADHLASVAASDTTLAGKAAGWKAAYDERTAERDTLLFSIVEMRRTILFETARGDSLERGAFLANRARIRADSVLDAVVASVVVCTVPGTFGKVRCPTRKEAAIGAVILTLAAPPAWRAAKRAGIRFPF